MPLIHCNFFSQALGLNTSMDVILPLPQWNGKARGQPHKSQTLYLLHGLSDDHTIWQRRTSIERYVEALDLAVVMPTVHRSFYTDMVSGYRYFTFISEEVPAVARTLFHLSDAREDNFIAGLSMGGYGAFKIALTKPQSFAAAASLSGVLDVERILQNPDPDFHKEMQIIYGNLDTLSGGPNDPFHLAETVAASKGPKPRLYQWCGKEDFLYAGNVKFHQHAAKLGLDLTYEEATGDHQWKYWDEKIQTVLAWIGPNTI